MVTAAAQVRQRQLGSQNKAVAPQRDGRNNGERFYWSDELPAG